MARKKGINQEEKAFQAGRMVNVKADELKEEWKIATCLGISTCLERVGKSEREEIEQ